MVIYENDNLEGCKFEEDFSVKCGNKIKTYIIKNIHDKLQILSDNAF